MPPLKRPSLPVMTTMVILFLASVLMVISAFPDWASFDRGRRIGPVDYRLSADFDAVGFDYTMETGSGDGSDPFGGIGGGLGSNFSISDSKSYPEVRGEFLDNIGILYNSYRTKTYQYELKMRSPPQDSDITWNGIGNPSAILNITLLSDLVPWWPETGRRTLSVDIELVKIDLWDDVDESERETFLVQVNKVQIWAKTGYDKGTGEYTGEDTLMGERSGPITFDRTGDSRSLDLSIRYPTGTDAAGFYVKTEGNMTDYWGRAELSPLSGKANPINVYPLTMGKLVSGVGIPLALPLMMISLILCLAALITAFLKGRFYLSLLIPATILSLLAPIWFMVGMNAAVDLLSERLLGATEGLSYQPGMFISFAGAAMMLFSLGISIYHAVHERTKAGREEENVSTRQTEPVFRKIENDAEEETGTEASRFRRLSPPQ
ncbi:MAG: hypothetical protein JXA22_03295 [Candidatus Thermoplasmatota archaeon]|nr:hypothetical protein [Candidatus Thermoplasmatota archaeon]